MCGDSRLASFSARVSRLVESRGLKEARFVILCVLSNRRGNFHGRALFA